MARVTITIEDHPHGRVCCISNPSFEEMMKLHAAKKGLQPSHGYALCAINAIRNASKIGAPFQAIVDSYNKDKKDGT